MTFGSRIREFFGRRRSTETAVRLAAPSSVISQVMVRAADEGQRAKVMNTLSYLWELWGDEERVYILARVEGTYPHLEKMADMEPVSVQWIEELTLATSVANDSVEAILQEQEENSALLDEIEQRHKDKPEE